ncbi:MAG: hypothetical protein QW491_09535 [Thermoproteota archaeon]
MSKEAQAGGATATSPRIQRLMIEPPNSVIPELQRFRDAPYKYKRWIVKYGDSSIDVVFYNNDAIVSTKERRFIFRTRTHKNYYELQLSVFDFPPELRYYVESENYPCDIYVTDFDMLVGWWQRGIVYIDMRER